MLFKNFMYVHSLLKKNVDAKKNNVDKLKKRNVDHACEELYLKAFEDYALAVNVLSDFEREVHL